MAPAAKAVSMLQSAATTTQGKLASFISSGAALYVTTGLQCGTPCTCVRHAPRALLQDSVFARGSGVRPLVSPYAQGKLCEALHHVGKAALLALADSFSVAA